MYPMLLLFFLEGTSYRFTFSSYLWLAHRKAIDFFCVLRLDLDSLMDSLY